MARGAFGADEEDTGIAGQAQFGGCTSAPNQLGTQVLCMLNSLGSINPPNWIRVLWCVLEGAIAASLVIAGGRLAIQMASVAVGLPIAFYMLLTGYSLMRSLFASEVVIAQEAPASMTIEHIRASGEMP